jgi:hypothetical protein
VVHVATWGEIVPKDHAFCLRAMCFKKNLLGPWNIRSPWREAILLNWGVTALSVPVPYGDPCVISSTAHFSNAEVMETNLEPT